MGFFKSASQLANGFRRLLAMAPKLAAMPLLALLFAGAAPSQAWSACQNTLDFTGAAIGDTRTLDVSSCDEVIKNGLYVSINIDSSDYYPMTNTFGFGSAANFTASNGAKLEFTPGPVISEQVLSYSVKLIELGSAGNGQVSLYYAVPALGYTNTAYTITLTTDAASPTLATINRNEIIEFGGCSIYFASGSGNNKAVSLFNGNFHFYPESSYFDSSGTILNSYPLSDNNIKYCIDSVLGIADVTNFTADGASGTLETDTDIGFSFKLNTIKNGFSAGTYVYSLVNGFSFTAKPNSVPVAVAGDDREVASGASVTLNGSGTDADNDTLTYSWSLISEADVAIFGAGTPNLNFTAPSVTVDTDLIFQLTVNDGKVGSEPDTVTITVNPPADTTEPTATLSLNDTALKIGELSILTITFSEAVTGFTIADLTVENGALSGLSSEDGGITWAAAYTPYISVTDATNIITLDLTGVYDQNANEGTGTAKSQNYAIDTSRPVAEITFSSYTLTTGETATVTTSFSEAVTGFTTADMSVENGTLSGLSSGDGGITWTATFTPDADITDDTNEFALDLTGVTDQNGNAGSGAALSPNYSINTAEPTITSLTPNSGPQDGGTEVTLIGTNLSGTTKVQIWGSDVTDLRIISATEISFKTPGGAPEAHEVSVTTPGGVVTMSEGFTYFASKEEQTITFDQPGNETFTDFLQLRFPATTSSGLALAITFDTPNICSGFGEFGIVYVDVLKVGSCTVTAKQAGNEDFAAAEDVSRTFTINKGRGGPHFANLEKAYKVGDEVSPLVLFYGESHTPGVSLFYLFHESNDASVCSRSAGGTLYFAQPGICRLVAHAAESENYLASQSEIFEITVNAAIETQTISFTSDAPDDAVFGGTYTPTATATSGLPVTFSIGKSFYSQKQITTAEGEAKQPQACQINNGLVTFTGVGECNVAASQAGSEEWDAAETVHQTFEVGKAENSIAFDQATPTTGVVGGSFQPIFTTAHDGETNFRVHDDNGEAGVCAQDGDAVEFLKAGRCSIQAHVVETEHYNRASTELHSITVTEATQNQTISFTSDAPDDAVYGGTYMPTATATSQLPVTFSIGSGLANAGSQSAVCQIAEGVVLFTGVGDCVVVASQAGDEEWNAAESVSQTFSVGNAVNSVAFTNQPPRRAITGASYTPVAMAWSGRTPVITVDASSADVCSISGGLVSFDAKGTCKLIASDAGGEGFEAALDASISFPIVDPLDISPASGNLGEIPFGVAFELQFEATGGFGGHTFALADGSILPPGLTLSSAGLLSGTPTEEGAVFVFSIIGTEGSISARLAGGDNSESNASVTGSYSISVGSNPDSDEIEQIGESSTESSAIVSGEVIVDVVSDAASEGFNDTPDLVTQYANGARITLGKQARLGSGLAAIDSVTLEDRKAMRARSGGSVPGLFAYADDGAAASDAVDPQRFQAWASIRFTHVSTSAALNNLEGQQINGLLGLNYRLNEQTVIGAFGGYETMDFADAGSAEFGGSGLTGGIYAAWRPDMGLRFEGQISTTQLGYDVNSGGITGSFDANRIIASLGVSGSTKLGTIYLEPSLKATSVWENQDGYTDSVGTVHDSRSFNFGKIAAGLKASTWIDLGEGKSISPYAGVSADWRFSAGDTTKTLEAMDDLSMSLNAGFNAKLNANTSLGLDGTVSGLGLDDIMVWSVRARLGIGF